MRPVYMRDRGRWAGTWPGPRNGRDTRPHRLLSKYSLNAMDKWLHRDMYHRVALALLASAARDPHDRTRSVAQPVVQTGAVNA